MPKVCTICKKEKVAASFAQWRIYEGTSRDTRRTGPRKPYCQICDKKLQAKYANDPVTLQQKIQIRLQEKSIEDAIQVQTRIDEEKAEAAKQFKPPKRPKQTRRTRSDYEKELLERELSKKSLVQFIKRFNPNYMAGWVHEDICRRLTKFLKAIEDGRTPRLMLFMPPRHGKSMIASHHFPAWALGHHPHLEIIAASYGSSLPMGFSRKVRAFLRDKKYNVLFPETKLDRTNENVEGWSTTKGGGYIPAGVGGGITGKGAHCFIVDDPIKDAEEADSETIRQNIWDWWGSTAYTRLAPNAGVLVIQTRWHDDDLSGRMISQMKEEIKEAGELRTMYREQGVEEAEVEKRYDQAMREIDQWEIIEYPAISLNDEWLNLDGTVTTEPNDGKSKFLRAKDEALHEERFDRTRLMKIKRTLQPRHWSALYQQNPVPEEGMYFTKGMFRYAPQPLFGTLPICIAWDLAIGKKQENDYTVGAVGAMDQYDNVHVLEVVRGKWNSLQIGEMIVDMYKKYYNMSTGGVLVGIERGQLELAVKPIIDQMTDEERLYPSFDETLVPITDKLIRARPLQGRMQKGRLIFPPEQYFPWVEDVRHELLRFPGGVHDDQVDALAWLARMFVNISAPKPSKPKPLKSWKDRLKLSGDRHPMTA
jgi:predicted phage terminase large subunit-like protein